MRRPPDAPPPEHRTPGGCPCLMLARSHGKPAASGRISAPSDRREWMSRSGYNIAEQIEILSLRRPAICHLGPGGQCVVCRALQTCNVGPGGGRPPPSRGGVVVLARPVPRSGGGRAPRPLASAARPHEASAVGGRRRKAPPFSRAVRPPFGASAAWAVAGWWFPRRPVAARPLAARAAVLPCCLLLPSRACLPPLPRPGRGGSPPSGAGRRSAPGMGAVGRPPPLRCAVRGLASRPVRGFSRPHPGGFVVPGALVLFSCSQFRPAGGARGPKIQKTVQKREENSKNRWK